MSPCRQAGERRGEPPGPLSRSLRRPTSRRVGTSRPDYLAQDRLCDRATPRTTQLGEAIRTVHAGEALLARSVTRRLVERFIAQQPAATARDVTMLTEREREVLVMIACGLSNTDIATGLFLSRANVKTHIRRIFAKLEVRDRAQAAIAAYNAGLVRAAHQS